MKNRQFIYLKFTLLLGFIFTLTVSCDRDPSDDLEFATFSKNPEVFIDGFSGGLQYLPFGGSKLDAFSVDGNVKYKGAASMRFDVPNVGDPDGAYAGAIFPDAAGRDLSDYDALTFWAKASQAATINEIGFGQDFGENKHLVTILNTRMSTNWSKYIIPIPDASKLTLEKGMFWYSEGPENGNGYTFWIDELKFEKLGTIAQPQPKILNGVDEAEETFLGITNTLSGLSQTFNMASGANQTVIAAPSYFSFSSTDVDVARVSELGVVSIVGVGSAKVTATLGNVMARGSLTVESLGSLELPPIPTHDPNSVISIFSNSYTNEPVEYYNGYWAPYQTTQGQDDIHINGDDIIKYTELNFVGIQFTQPTIDVSQMTHFHIDVWVDAPNPLEPGDFLKIKLQDIGADDAFEGGDDTSHELQFTSADLTNGSWVSLDLPLSDFTGLTSRTNLAQVVILSDATITDILVDNIYFHN